MAKIFINSKNPESRSRCNRWASHDFPTNFWANEIVGCQTAEKLATGGTNLFVPKDGDCVACAGTVLTNDGEMEADALKRIYNNFNREEPLSVRDFLFGHYILFVWINSEGFIFCDPIASYYCFYRIEDSESVEISNLLSEFLDENVSDVDTIRLIRGAFEGHAGYGGHTFLPNVNRLTGNKFIYLKENNGNIAASVVPGKTRSDEHSSGSLEEFNATAEKVFRALGSV